jgi:hypothetical protein
MTHIFAMYRYPSLTNNDQWDSLKESFEIQQGIPNIVGAIDGTHITLAMPCGDRWKGYINCKHWPSIVFQCVVDASGNFRNVSLVHNIK